MTRLQTFLLLVLGFATLAVVAQADWPLVLPAAIGAVTAIASFFSEVPSIFGAIPAWVWWTAFGIAISLSCSRKFARYGRACGNAHRRRAPASSAL